MRFWRSVPFPFIRFVGGFMLEVLVLLSLEVGLSGLSGSICVGSGWWVG